jgi:hypothetical protein
MTPAAIAFAVLACVTIAAIGLRFLVVPTAATRDFGVQPDDARALTAIKGVARGGRPRRGRRVMPSGSRELRSHPLVECSCPSTCCTMFGGTRSAVETGRVGVPQVVESAGLPRGGVRRAARPVRLDRVDGAG